MGEQTVTKERTRSFFGKNEGILLISSNYNEKQQIEEGLNREVKRVDSTESLVDAMTGLRTDDGVRASVILTKETPPEIRQNFSDVIRLLEVTKVDVFEIKIDKTVKNAYRFHDIIKFLQFARNQKRKEKISYVKDEEQKTILEELQLETDAQKEEIDRLQQKIDVTEEEMEKLSFEYDGLQKEIETVYKAERDDAVEKMQTLEENIEDLQRRYDTEKSKSNKYREEKDEALNELTDLRVERESYKKFYREKESEIRKLKRQLDNKEKKIRQVIREKEELFETRVDSEDHVVLSQELENMRKEKEQLENDIAKIYVQHEQRKFEMESLKDEILFMKEGEENLQDIGRTLNVDTHIFEKLDLVYIKVFEDLPYFRKAAKIFYDKVSKMYDGTTHLMILRHDDGMDSQYFEGVPLWSKVGDIPEEDSIVRMFPNPYLFTGANRWEKEVDCLMIVDYMKNDEYYATTQAKEKVMTVVRKDEDIEEYGLKGSPIALDGRSVYNIKYSEQIDNTMLASNRERRLEGRVDDWVKNIFG